MQEPVQELKLIVPTYNGQYFADEVASGERSEFGDPEIPLVIREAGGVRIVLGTHDYDDCKMPDVQIERHPNGWMIFLHPVGGGDAAGYVFFLDDGRSFLVKEFAYGTPAIEVVEPRDDDIPEIDGPPTAKHPLSDSAFVRAASPQS